MEIKEFSIHIGDERIAVFVYDSFFSPDTRRMVSAPHTHGYAEVHFTEFGQARISTEEGELISDSGTLTVIPADKLHSVIIPSNETSHRTFFINYPVSEVSQHKYPLQIFEELRACRCNALKTNNFTAICAYFAFLCKDFISAESKPKRVNNERFIISEFFVNCYSSDVKLSDLAEQLGLCEKQTARLVEKYMGASFSKVLTSYRMNAAKSILKSSQDVTLTEVAGLVGYRSYSGFWKAFKKFEQ